MQFQIHFEENQSYYGSTCENTLMRLHLYYCRYIDTENCKNILFNDKVDFDLSWSRLCFEANLLIYSLYGFHHPLLHLLQTAKKKSDGNTIQLTSDRNWAGGAVVWRSRTWLPIERSWVRILDPTSDISGTFSPSPLQSPILCLEKHRERARRVSVLYAGHDKELGGLLEKSRDINAQLSCIFSPLSGAALKWP